MGNTCTMETESCGFQCTNYKGGHRWEQLRKAEKEFNDKIMAIAEGVECGTCQPHAVSLMSFAQDHVALGLGENSYDKANYHKVVDEIICVRDNCLKDGRC